MKEMGRGHSPSPSARPISCKCVGCYSDSLDGMLLPITSLNFALPSVPGPLLGRWQPNAQDCGGGGEDYDYGCWEPNDDDFELPVFDDDDPVNVKIQ